MTRVLAPGIRSGKLIYIDKPPKIRATENGAMNEDTSRKLWLRKEGSLPVKKGCDHALSENICGINHAVLVY